MITQGFKWPPVFEADGDMILVQDAAEISQSLVALFRNMSKEIFLGLHLPSGDLRPFLFEQNTGVLEVMIESKVREAVRNHEPRIRVLEVQFNTAATMQALTDYIQGRTVALELLNARGKFLVVTVAYTYNTVPKSQDFICLVSDTNTGKVEVYANATSYE